MSGTLGTEEEEKQQEEEEEEEEKEVRGRGQEDMRETERIDLRR